MPQLAPLCWVLVFILSWGSVVWVCMMVWWLCGKNSFSFLYKK
uniref:ATP synthase F0 subunit 8 n=1 Tax=Scrobicularia plana TaxID=665965 RepID=A0A6H2U262_9BIVA|nr:ATP synthase F0 subunit 8 [Scrobicularia plana]